MRIKKTIYVLLGVILLLLLLASLNLFNHKKVYKNEVVIHVLSDPKGLNPLTVSDATTRNYISPYVFQPLIAYDFKTYNMLPVLAKAVPEVIRNGNELTATLEIRPEAIWDDGTPITANDVAFSYKAVMCPNAQTANLRPGVDFFKEIILYPDNPRKITFRTGLILDLLSSFYEIKILPENVFDPKHILRKYSFSQLISDADRLSTANDIKEFTDFFNSDKAAHDIDMAKGSAAYKAIAFETGQRVILEKKKNWWGDKLVNVNMYFEAFPKRLVFETINDFNTAFTALKNEQLDFVYSTPIKDYIDLDNSPKFTKNFIKSNPPMFGYQGIGMNYSDPILKDTIVRRALAHLMNVDQLIDKVFYGFAQRTVGSIQPGKPYYNTSIKPYTYDPDLAMKMLSERGWKDADNDGVLDKVIDGKKTDFELTYTYNSGNPVREMVGLLFQRACYQAGIRINVKPMDWSLFLDDLKKHKCQLWYQGWVSAPGLEDDKQIYHTSGAIDGGNYMSFGNAKTDKLIEDIRVEMDSAKRNAMYLQWQEIQNADLPYIYLYIQIFRNCIHKRFENLHETSIYPGAWFAGFKVKKGYKVED